MTTGNTNGSVPIAIPPASGMPEITQWSDCKLAHPEEYSWTDAESHKFETVRNAHLRHQAIERRELELTALRCGGRYDPQSDRVLIKHK